MSAASSTAWGWLLVAWAVLVPARLAAQPLIVFSGREGQTTHLYRLDPVSLAYIRLTRSPANEMEPAVAPDGRRVVFVSDRDGARALYLIDVATPDADWQRLTPAADRGAYAHPAFTPDGTHLAAQYAPDPAQPFQRTQIVSLSPADGVRTVLLDGARAFPADPAGDSLVVVDHPAWFDATRLLFAAVEYSGGAAPRVTASAIWRLDRGGARPVRLVGGESGYDARGRLRGIKATMPRREGSRVAFVAIRGSVDRVPMTMRPDGRGAARQPVSDPDFAGPCLAMGGRLLYVVRDDDGNGHLVVRRVGEKTRRVVPFPGDASEPAVAGP